MSKSIKITNRLNVPIIVIASERPVWKVADILVDGASFLTGFSDLKAVMTGVFKLPEILASFGGFWDGVSAVRQIVKGANAGEKMIDAAERLWDTITKGNVIVQPGATIDIYDESTLEAYFSVSGIAAMNGANTMTLSIVTTDKALGLTTMSDIPESWIVSDNGIQKTSGGPVSPWDGEPRTTARVSLAGGAANINMDNYLGWRDPSGNLMMMPLVDGFWSDAVSLGVQSPDGPGLALIGSDLWYGYKGMDGGLWVATTTLGQSPSSGGGRLAPGPIGIGPRLVEFEGRCYMFWIDTNQNIFYSSRAIDFSDSWTVPAQIVGSGSSIGPCAAVFQGKLYLAWMGAGGDQTNWFTSFDGTSFAPQQPMVGGSALGPDLAVYKNRLYAAWRGAGSDESIWMSSFDGTSWAPQTQIPGVGSSIGPALATDPTGVILYATWRGAGPDDVIWNSFYDGTSWIDQRPVLALA